jgi:hypothetical protein
MATSITVNFSLGPESSNARVVAFSRLSKHSFHHS